MLTYKLGQKAVVVNGEDKILAVFRGAGAPYMPNKWDIPGGVIEEGEAFIPAITREVREEAGIAVSDLHLIDVHNVAIPGDIMWVTLCYVCKAVSTEVKLSFEHDEYRWVTPEEFLQLDSFDKIQQFVRAYQQYVQR